MIKNIILDLDNTLVSSIKTNESNKESIMLLKKQADKENIIKYYDLYNDEKKLIYVVFTRPNLNTFLDYVFSKYNVSIWTAGTRCYASFIIKNIMKNRKIDYVFFDYHVNISTRIYKQPKNLNLLSEHFKLQDYSTEYTVIIDDSTKISDPENITSKKNYKSILCTYYDISKGISVIINDKELLKIIEILKTKYNSKTLSIINNDNNQQLVKINTVKFNEPKNIADKMPKGWKKVPSQSRPGEFSYENIYTQERIPDPPKYEASRIENKSQDLKDYD